MVMSYISPRSIPAHQTLHKQQKHEFHCRMEEYASINVLADRLLTRQAEAYRVV
jgi:hypothetical protein